MNGYYYWYNNNNKATEIFVFYNNSIFMDCGVRIDTSFTHIEAFLVSQKFNDKNTFGLFKIENNTLTIEQWKFDGGLNRVVTSKANIFNDFTFQIVLVSSSTKGERDISKENRIYHFREFSPKPDSTNSFIP